MFSGQDTFRMGGDDLKWSGQIRGGNGTMFDKNHTAPTATGTSRGHELDHSPKIINLAEYRMARARDAAQGITNKTPEPAPARQQEPASSTRLPTFLEKLDSAAALTIGGVAGSALVVWGAQSTGGISKILIGATLLTMTAVSALTAYNEHKS